MESVSNNMPTAITQNKQLYNKMKMFGSFITNAQNNNASNLYTDKVVYYNDEVEIKNKEKKKLSKKILALTTTAITTIGGVVAGIALIKRRHKILDKGKMKDFYGKILNAIECIGVNFSSTRDDLTRKGIDKLSAWKPKKESEYTPFKFLKFFKEKSMSAYDYCLEKIAKSRYNKSKGDIMRLISEGEINADDVKILKFDEWYKNAYKVAKETLTEGETTIADDFIHKKMKVGEFLKKFVTEIPANERLKDKQIYTPIIINNPEKLSKETKKAIEKHNRNLKEITEKMRDNVIGNALGDFIGAGITTGALATGIGLETDKEERKSKAINLGIPLGTTVLSMIVGNILMLPAIKSMVSGLLIGQIGTITANSLTANVEKQKEEVKKLYT